jgi:RNA polymerase sigma-70 factor (ECF subfamily)
VELKLQYFKNLSHHDDAGLIIDDLMKEYGHEVWSYAYVMTRRREAADDLMQEVFLSAFRLMHTFRGESSMKTWLLSMTRNKCLNYLKSSFLRKVTLMDRIHSTLTVHSAEQELLDRIQTQEIWNIVMKLPIKYREVILLEAHYGYTEQEMADILGVPNGTIKSRLHRARAKVEQAIKEGDL